MLNISNYTKVYPGGKTAVDGLTLHVAPGEICGFIGHNGAGKTTTLRAVVGVMSFTQGTITIGGHDIQKEPVAAKSITAFLPDNPDLYEFMSGISYLNLIADLYGISARDREARIRKYADAFGLTGDLGGAIASYSHLLKGYLAELCREGGAVFFSTHVLEVAEKLCHTIAIIQDGRLVRHGPTEEVVGDSSLEDVFLGLTEKEGDR